MPDKPLPAGRIQPGEVCFLSRPRIDNLIRKALKKPLTTVIAGAGYGKTHAVSSVMQSEGHLYAWLQLSELDNVVSILWERLICAAEDHSPDFAGSLKALGYPDSPTSLYQLLQLIAHQLENTARFVLVLDDFHLIQDARVLYFFEKLIAAAIPNLAIVLISREKPGLPLSKLLAKGLMARITEDDLHFTQHEMEAYYQMQGVSLDAGAYASLYAFTEGWVLAIYLVGLHLKRGSDQVRNLMSQARIDISQLIEEEIFNAASEKLQSFLIVLAQLDRIPAGLLRALAQDAPEILTEMSSSSLLIQYDPHTDRYRMHRLFRDFLTARAHTLPKDMIARTHLSAAQWYREHNRPEEAIDHYWKCNHFDEIFDIILSVRTRVSKDVADSYIMLIDNAPAAFIQARPIMRVVKAQYLMNNNRIQEAQDELNLICAAYEALPPTDEHLAILGDAYVLLALISIVRQNLDFVSLFQKADRSLPNGSALIDHRLNIAEGINVTGIKNPLPGELKRYQDALFEAAPYAVKVMNGCGYGMEYLNATDAAFMTGDVRNAEKHAYETVFRAQQQRQYGIEFMAYFYLVRICVYKGDYPKIASILSQLKEQTERLNNADCRTLRDIIEGWFFVKIGQPTKVPKWIMVEQETRKMLAPVVLGREYLVRSDCLLAQGRDLELLGFMKQSDDFYEARGILFARIQNKITESIIYHYMGNHAESMRALKAAYDLSHANNLVMQYIEYGSKMRAVIHAAAQDKHCGIPKPWLDKIHTKSSTYAKRLSQVVSHYEAENREEKKEQVNLSKRELEVLTCLSHGFTRDEIADACYLSANTVTNIQQSIYNKLGAINGLDAVRIATMMNLVGSRGEEGG